MTIFKKTALAALATAAMTTAAAAQDWSGAYLGAYTGLAYGGTDPMVGALAGYQTQMDRFVVGGEADALYAFSSGDYELFARARAGYLVTDSVLVFATAGVGTYKASLGLYSAGLGAEFAMTDSLSLRADVELHQELGSSLTSGPVFAKIGTGWRF